MTELRNSNKAHFILMIFADKKTILDLSLYGFLSIITTIFITGTNYLSLIHIIFYLSTADLFLNDHCNFEC